MTTKDSNEDSKMVAEPRERRQPCDSAMPEDAPQVAAAAAGAEAGSDVPHSGKRGRVDDGTVRAKVMNIADRQEDAEGTLRDLVTRVQTLEEQQKRNVGVAHELEQLTGGFQDFVKPASLTRHLAPIIPAMMDQVFDARLQILADNCKGGLDALKVDLRKELQAAKERLDVDEGKSQAWSSGVDEKLTEQLRRAERVEEYLGDLQAARPQEGKTVVDAFQLVEKRLAEVDEKFAEQLRRAERVEEYLGDLQAARPQEGKTVVDAFQLVEKRLAEIDAKASQSRGAGTGTGAGTSSGHGGAAGVPGISTGTGTTGDAGSFGLPDSKLFLKGSTGDDGEIRRLRAALDEHERRLELIQQQLQERCHCHHVEAQGNNLEALQLQVDSLADAFRASQTRPRSRSRGAGTGTGTGTGSGHGGGATSAPVHCAACGGGAHGQGGFPVGGGLRGGAGDGPGAPGAPGISGSSTAPGGGGGTPGGGGDSGTPWFCTTTYGGNGLCHCRHVGELQFVCSLLSTRITSLERLQTAADPAGRRDDAPPTTAGQPGDATPLRMPPGVPHMRINTPGTAAAHDSRAPFLPGFQPTGNTTAAATATGQQPAARAKLVIGALGSLERADGRLFEDKMTAMDDFRFDGQKGGDRWKGRLERYFISKSPALKAVLTWAEKENMEVVTQQLFEEVAGHALDTRQREALNAAIWGFLSNCISGEAETIFKRAESLNGLDAWRRLVRHIDHGRAIRLEALRTEVRSIHLKPIKSLEQVALGIAEFENKITEYEEAGGRPVEGDEMKTDLLAILPEALRENLLWRATDPGDYTTFRNMVQGQTAKVLLNRRRLPVHNVQAEEEEPDLTNLSSVEDFILAFRKFAGGSKRTFQRQQTGNKNGDRPPRALKCPNCGEEHERTQCKKPILPVSERLCWTCGKKGCTAAKCPMKGKKKDTRLVDNDDTDVYNFGCMTVTAPGEWQEVRRGGKPQPRGAILEDYIVDRNKFQALSNDGHDDPRPNGRRTDATANKAQRRAAATAAWNEAQDHTVDSQSLFTAVPGSKEFNRLFPDLSNGRPTKSHERPHDDDFDLDCIELEDLGDEMLAAADVEQVTKVRVAMDSGAVAPVINAAELPANAEVVPNRSGQDFVGAGGDKIRRHGTCKILMRDGNGRKISTNWQVADVSRALHSVSDITGPEEGDGLHDVLFNNKKCVVVPHGVVNAILKKVEATTEYRRKGGLYVADMTLSSFTRQGPGR